MMEISCGALIVGNVASRFIITFCELVPPELVAVQFIVWPAVSVVMFVVVHSGEVIDDSASATDQETDTSPIYQSLSPISPIIVGVICGGVVSGITEF